MAGEPSPVSDFIESWPKVHPNVAVFTAGRLEAKEIDQAFPLISAGSSDLSLLTWRRFAKRLLADPPPAAEPEEEGKSWPRMGIVAVRSMDAYLHGLFCYRVVEDLRTGPAVWVHDFVALGLLHQAEAVATLVTALEGIATCHGCTQMHVHLPGRRATPLPARNAAPGEAEGSVLQALKAHGFRCSSLTLERNAITLS